MVKKAPVWRRVDIYLFFLIAGLLAVGSLFLYSATFKAGADAAVLVGKQALWIGIGLVLMLSISLLPKKVLGSLAYPAYGMTLLLLLAVLFVGKETLGAQRWIALGGFTLQPSEFAKVGLILGLAKVLSGLEAKPEKSHLLKAGAIFAAMAMLVIIQPDLGTTLVLVAITMGVLFAAGWEVKWLAGLIIVLFLGVLSGFYFNLMPSYQQDRLTVFLNPEEDLSGKGYNLFQSQVAIGSGGVWGKGLTKGSQSRLNFLPHNDTDFIFSVVGEEGGFRITILTLILFFLLINRAISLGGMASESFDTLVAVGIASMLTFQAVINIGMTIGVMPVTGIPLPFLSYGGSSLITTLIAMGLLFNISSRRLLLR